MNDIVNENIDCVDIENDIIFGDFRYYTFIAHRS